MFMLILYSWLCSCTMQVPWATKSSVEATLMNNFYEVNLLRSGHSRSLRTKPLGPCDFSMGKAIIIINI